MPSVFTHSRYGSTRNFGASEEGDRPPPFTTPTDVLAAELPVLRALHEGRIDHLADVDRLDLVVVDAEDRDGVFELLHAGGGVERRHRRAAADEEVVRV